MYVFAIAIFCEMTAVPGIPSAGQGLAIQRHATFAKRSLAAACQSLFRTIVAFENFRVTIICMRNYCFRN
jgi:hypothetical protein